jgi:hypothetical protein
MTSSTSHSSKRLPLLALKYAVCALVTWLACAVYAIWLNPEMRFFTRLSAVQKAWAQKMDAEHGRKVVIFGGSSCMFSIRGEQMLAEAGLPTVNCGAAASFSVKVPALQAFESLNTGDTLLIAIEPEQLTDPIDLTSIAVQFSFATGHPAWALQSALGLPKMSVLSAALALRPGSYHTLTLMGKLLRGGPLYRYNIEDASTSGWMRTAVRLSLQGPPRHGPELSPDAESFLASIRDSCAAKGVRIAYSLPWALVPHEETGAFRRSNARFLARVSRFIPVLRDEKLGSHARPEDFADTAWHLNEAGAELRTRQLGEAVKNWKTWSLAELEELAEGRNHAEPGIDNR